MPWIDALIPDNLDWPRPHHVGRCKIDALGHRQPETVEPHRGTDADLRGAELDDRIAVHGADIAQKDLAAVR